MAVRFNDLPLDKTKVLMSKIVPVMKTGERVMFLVEPAQGEFVVQRIRVMMARARKKLKQQGKKLTHFRLHHDVVKWTESGKRHDAVFMWTSRSPNHEYNEMLEDLLSHD